jgi:hypothetical protein
VDTKELDVDFVIKKHASHKERKVKHLMNLLSKEDAPLNELPCMVLNDRYVDQNGAEPQFVYNCVHILCGDRTSDNHLLFNISICALVKKWKYDKKPGAVTEADKAYDPSYVAQTIFTILHGLLTSTFGTTADNLQEVS